MRLDGIPIVNKRVSVAQSSIIGAATDRQTMSHLRSLTEQLKIGVNFIGGFSALVQKRYQKGDEFL